ncbi:MAG: hypothetical protein ACI8SE_000819 [Bacteroidia bacterium]
MDMSLNQEKDAVVSKGIKLLDKVIEKQTAILHDNCDDVWIITHGYESDAFYAFPLSESGLNTTPVISHSGQVQTGSDKVPFEGGTKNYSPESMAKGYMQSSPNGKKNRGLALHGSSQVSWSG